MKFPIGYCVPTKHLTKTMYDLLLTKLITEGYHWPSQTDKSCYFDLWAYLGCTPYGDIMLYDNNFHFLRVGEDEHNNVLSKDWLLEYLLEAMK